MMNSTTLSNSSSLISLLNGSSSPMIETSTNGLVSSVDGSDQETSVVNCWSDDATSILFQLAYICLLIAYLVPGGKYCLLFIHFVLALAHLLITIWVSKICITIPSLLGWSIIFLCVNIIRVAIQLYTTRHIKFAQELEEIYEELFATIGVTRESFRKLAEQGKMMTLHSGESYAVEKVTVTNRLSLLISGKVNVVSRNHFLHSILPGEFLDSPEWESGIGITISTTTGKARERGTLGNLGPIKRNIHFEDDDDNNGAGVGATGNNKPFPTNQPLMPFGTQFNTQKQQQQQPPDNRFNVSLIAATQCRILCWNRVPLEYLLAKDKQIFKVLGLVLGRDITNKLYAMNEKIISDKGSILDIRLPVIITSLSRQLETMNGRKQPQPTRPVVQPTTEVSKQTVLNDSKEIEPLIMNDNVQQNGKQQSISLTTDDNTTTNSLDRNSSINSSMNSNHNHNDHLWLPMKPLLMDDQTKQQQQQQPSTSQT